jgi:hypothetical protein
MLRLALAALLLAAAPARATQPTPPPEGGAPRGEDRPWESGTPRAFAAGRLEAGLHGRVLLQLGYGQPHWAWAGIQGAALVTPHTAGVEAAVRGALPFLDLQVALRRTRSFDRPLLAARESHGEAELEGGHARLTVLDADLSGVVPVPGGLAAWELEWVRPLGLAAGAHAFEETWQVAVGPRGAGAFRLGWLAGPFLGRARLGPFAEAVRLFGRDETVVRAGGALLLTLGPHLSLLASGFAPVSGPDRFDAFTATYGTLALRWAFATGDPAPGLP